MDVNAVVKDGQKLASHTAKGFAVVGGVVAGIGMGIADMKFDLVGELLSAIGFENDFLAKALTILLGIVIVGGFVTASGIVSNSLVKGILTFMAVAVGTWLLVFVIRTIVGIFKGNKGE